MQNVPFIFDFQSIRAAQAEDARLVALRQTHPESYADQLLAPNTMVTCYISQPGKPWKVYLPTPLLDQAVRWYHLALGHIGQSRLYDTMRRHFYHPDLKTKVEDLVSKCDVLIGNPKHEESGSWTG